MSRPAELAAELRRRLGPAPPPPSEPRLVSVVVVSHDGAEQLRTLLRGLIERTDYPRLELIVVDNGSSDESLDFLRSVPAPFPISIVANPHNESFSDANNQGAALARGELLLFLNNDVEPFESGWLLELVACLQRTDAGAVGSTQIYPQEIYPQKKAGGHPHGFAVQHRGLRFRSEKGTLGPALHEWQAEPLDERLGEDAEVAVVVASCLLVGAELFERVGGFSRGYIYGSEDVDFSFKLRAAGESLLCSGRSLLIHRPGSTRRNSISFEDARARRLRNHRLLLSRWGPRLRREHDLQALDGGGMWVQLGREDGAAATDRAEAEAPSLCIRASDPPPSVDGRDSLEALQADAASRGHRCIVLRGEQIDDLGGLECDIAVYVRGGKRYVPVSGQFNVLWACGTQEDLSGAEADRYDVVLTERGDEAIRLRAAARHAEIHVVPAAATLDTALVAARASGRPLRIEPGRRRQRGLGRRSSRELAA